MIRLVSIGAIACVLMVHEGCTQGPEVRWNLTPTLCWAGGEDLQEIQSFLASAGIRSRLVAWGSWHVDLEVEGSLDNAFKARDLVRVEAKNRGWHIVWPGDATLWPGDERLKDLHDTLAPASTPPWSLAARVDDEKTPTRDVIALLSRARI